MLKDGIDFVKRNYSEFIKINLEINSAKVSNAIDFAKINRTIENLLSDARNKLIYFTRISVGADVSIDPYKLSVHSISTICAS